MGKRGPVARARSVGHRNHPSDPVTVSLSSWRLANPGAATPKPTPGWLRRTNADWRSFWDDPVSGYVQQVDLPVVYRLFDMKDELARARRVTKQTLMVKGSMGQVRVNPLADHCLKLEAAILRLETELGMTPLGRARLGVNAGEALQQMARINAMIQDDPEEAPDAGDADPRQAALQLADPHS